MEVGAPDSPREQPQHLLPHDPPCRLVSCGQRGCVGAPRLDKAPPQPPRQLPGSLPSRPPAFLSQDKHLLWVSWVWCGGHYC